MTTPRPDSDEAERLASWTCAVAAGDRDALRSLFDATSARIHGLVRRILPCPSTSEEIVAEVYVRAWTSAARFDPARGSAFVWLAAIARHLAIDQLRRMSSRPSSEDALLLEDEPASGPSPVQQSLYEERRRVVRRAVALLPAEQRQAIERTFFRGLSHTQAAAELRQPLGTLKSRVRAALVSIRHSLESSGAHEEGVA